MGPCACCVPSFDIQEPVSHAVLEHPPWAREMCGHRERRQTGRRIQLIHHQAGNFSALRRLYVRARARSSEGVRRSAVRPATYTKPSAHLLQRRERDPESLGRLRLRFFEQHLQVLDVHLRRRPARATVWISGQVCKPIHHHVQARSRARAVRARVRRVHLNPCTLMGSARACTRARPPCTSDVACA